MGLGILEFKGRSQEHVDGTEIFLSHEANSSKHGESIILIPQPNNSKYDPLTWPLWKRDCYFAILCYLTCVAASLAPLLATSSIVLLFDFERNFTDIALLTGDFLLGMAVGGLVVSAWGRAFGKRVIYITFTALMLASSCWNAASTSYASFAWSRVVQGFSTAPFEILVPITVADMYHVHQRGTRMAIFSLCLVGVSFLSPIPAGAITQNGKLLWPWMFWLVAIFAAPGLILVVLFCPETTFDRVETPQENLLTTDSSFETNNLNFWETLALGRKSYLSLENWKRLGKYLVRPFTIILTPHILWAMGVQGLLLCWTVTISTVIGGIFGGIPYFLGSRDLGLLYFGPFVGSIVGFLLAGIISDHAIRIMTRWNRGVYEAEFRMVLLILQLIFSAIGLFGFGNSVVNRTGGTNAVPSMFYGFVTAATVIGATCAGTYILDAFWEINNEAFVCLLFFKSFATYGISTMSYDWIETAGVDKVSNIMGGVQVGVTCITMCFYFFGKLNRQFFARHDVFKLFGVY